MPKLNRLYRIADRWFLEQGDVWSAPSVESVAALMLGKISPAAFTKARHKPARKPSADAFDAPVLGQEVWAAGVTYRRSASAWVADSQTSASIYDRIYGAKRLQTFFKAAPGMAVGHGGYIGIRGDATQTHPEAELAVVASPNGRVVGYTLGDDVSARDIEAANPLYQPQSKVFNGSAALGPALVLAGSGVDPLAWTVRLSMERGGKTYFAGSCSFGQLGRGIDEILKTHFAFHDLPNGIVVMTGTGIVVPDDKMLAPDDKVRIACDAVGELVSTAKLLR
jgi:2-dehydro-3-deoxy-D-arabinonate dehydratase